MSSPKLLRGLLSFSSMTMVSRVLGLVRDFVVTTTFGTNAITDAFWVAFRVPNFLRRLFAEGSFATAFVPVFTEVKETRSHAELRELMSRTAGTLGGVLMLVTALVPHIGYQRAAEVAKRAHRENGTLREAALALGYATEEELERWLDPSLMLGDRPAA